jgi:3-methyl-2-oxobutanoate hydroxymethyltransferase
VKVLTAKVTVNFLNEAKRKGEKITMLTAYDFPTAAAMDGAGIDMILIGDSLGMAVLGYDSTIPVTMDDMVHHTKPVVRATKRAMVIADMPFMSYHVSKKEALHNAGRLMQEGGADGVKLEGGVEVAKAVRKMVDAGIPVVGHLGLTPQSVNVFGGYGLRAKGEEEADKLLADALALQEAGACAVVLEKIPTELAKKVTEALAIPTIGIGAGPDCDGQVLVVHDLLGIFEKFTPKFCKKYAQIGPEMKRAFAEYAEEVKSGVFPAEEHTFHVEPKKDTEA